MSKTTTIARMHRDGTLSRVLPGRRGMPLPIPALVPMAPEAVRKRHVAIRTRDR